MLESEPTMKYSLLSCACAALLIVMPGAAYAQTVRGQTIDTGTGQPIAGVRVTLLTASGTRVAEAISTVAGRFSFLARSAGEHKIQTSHIGYAALTTGAFTVRENEVVEVDVKLTTAAIALEPLTITARRRDPVQDATEEGFYARRLRSKPIGNSRVLLPHDPEMVNSTNATDVLSWLPRSTVAMGGRACTIVFWNGRPLLTQADMQLWMETPIAQLEGMEYYRNAIDAPAALREMPASMGFENALCSIIALWPRTGRYLAEEMPPVFPTYNWQAHIAPVIYHVSGKYAPGVGFGLDITPQWPIRGALSLGVVARLTLHQLDAATTQQMTSTLSSNAYVLPPGQRGLQIWVVGVEPRLNLRRLERVSGSVSARVQLAERRFSIQKNQVGNDAQGVRSYGFGLGAAAGIEIQVSDRFSLAATLAEDWFTFAEYKSIEQATVPLAATWTGIALRLGFVYQITNR
jgi:hypothetical protein